MFILMLISSTIIYSQNLGIRIGLTTATLTGNNDAYDFDFIDSFSPGYKLGVLGNFQLSDVITLKPEISYRLYSVKQKISNNLYQLEQTHQSGSFDLNFDIKLPNSWSLIFGMGLDYLILKKYVAILNNTKDIYDQDISGHINDQRLDPFANIGLCYTIGTSILIDLEYRHLLDNWGVGDFNNLNELISSDNRSVKLHMINLSAALLF